MLFQHLIGQRTTEGVMGVFIKELWNFLRIRKKMWVTPIIGMIVLVVGLLVLAEGSVIAPFIYSLF